MAPRTVEKGRTSRPFSRSRIAKPSSSLCLRLGGLFLAAAMRLALEDAGRLAAPSAQVIELGAAHLAAAHDLDRVDHRRIDREHALHALAVGDLAHREVLVEAVAGAPDTDALIGLDAGALALDHLDVHQDGVARLEVGDLLAGGQLGHLLFFEFLNEVHGGFSVGSAGSARRAVSRVVRVGRANTLKARLCHPSVTPWVWAFWTLAWSPPAAPHRPPRGPAGVPGSAFRLPRAARPRSWRGRRR